MYKYNYANNLSIEERDNIWISLNREGEIEYVFSYTEKLANSMSDPSKFRSVNREDRLELERWFAKMEMALSKMFDNSRYSSDVVSQYQERYNKCVELSGHINQRSVAD